MRADGVFHQAFFFVFGDHDDRQTRVDLFDLRNSGQPVESGHHFVDQQQIHFLIADQLDAVFRVGGGFNIVSLVAQKKDVGLQKFNLVIDPQYFGFIHLFSLGLWIRSIVYFVAILPRVFADVADFFFFVART